MADIEEGKWYRLNTGEVVGPAHQALRGDNWYLGQSGPYYASGAHVLRSEAHQWVAEEVPAPEASIEDDRTFIQDLINGVDESIQKEAAMIQTPTSRRVQLLEKAAAVTSGDRDDSYGPPIVNLTAAGELKLLMRKHMVRDISPGELEALDQVLTKIGRIITGPKITPDNYIDGATYFGIAGEIAEANEDRRG